jgi:hypothetical protein
MQAFARTPQKFSAPMTESKAGPALDKRFRLNGCVRGAVHSNDEAFASFADLEREIALKWTHERP